MDFMEFKKYIYIFLNIYQIVKTVIISVKLLLIYNTYIKKELKTNNFLLIFFIKK